MAADVRRPSKQVENHPKGEGLFIHDGHLIVGSNRSQSNSSTLAVYAPGQWITAKIVQEEKG